MVRQLIINFIDSCNQCFNDFSFYQIKESIDNFATHLTTISLNRTEHGSID